MDTTWSTALWRQYGAAIDTLDNVVSACPDALWTQRLWPDPPPPGFPPPFAEFWYVTYHALVWLDLYLAGVAEEDYAPPAPFAQGEIDSAEALPARPYSREELRGYLASTRRRCRDTLAALTDEQARRLVAYPWTEGQSVTYVELQLYNLRHVQEHTAHLSLFLGQHGIPGDAIDWVTRAKDGPDEP